MDELLLLTHRIPYPPNKGDKIRSFNLLKHLSTRYRVHLGTFVDDPDDWRHVEAVRALCGETYFAALQPRLARLRSLTALGRGQPLTLAYYRDAALQAWAEQVLARYAIRRVLVFSSAMAQFIRGPRYRHLHRVIDFVDVDSDKWLQYSRSQSWPWNWLYRREGRALLRFEQAIAGEFAASVFVSAQEAKLFRRLAPAAARISFAGNGVDTDFFDPALPYPNPYPMDAPVLVFTGAMDYWANVDAVCWFASSVFPAVRQALPTAQFAIVGARPAAAVCRLQQWPGVQVIGAVPDVRPYLAHARAAVAPLRIARGIQNKVLEAMAMAKPVVVTAAAADGILPCPPLEGWLANEPAALAVAAVRLLQHGDTERAAQARLWTLQYYHWRQNLGRIEQLLQPVQLPTGPADAPAGAWAGGV